MTDQTATPSPPDTTAAAVPAPPPDLHDRGQVVRECVRNMLTLIVVGLIIAGGTWRNYWQNGDDEQYRLLLTGRAVYHGKTVYVQAPHDGLPGIVWANASAYLLGSGTPVLAWLRPGLAATTALMLVAIAAGGLLNPRAGRRIALLGAVALCVDTYNGPSIDPYFYAATASCAAMSLFILSWTAERRAWRLFLAIGSGLCWTLALSMSHLGILGLVILSAGGLSAALVDRDERPERLATILCVWTGFFVALAIMIVLLAAGQQAATAWHHLVASWHEQFTAMDVDQQHVHAVRALAPVGLLVWFAMIGIIAAAMRLDARRLSPAMLVTLSVWWLGLVALLATEPVVVMRHWLVAFPPMLLLAAGGVYHVGEAIKQRDRRHRMPMIVAMITIVLLLGRPLFVEYRSGLREARAARRDPAGERNRLRAIAAAIRDAVPPYRRIFVLADEPGVYVHADRPPASPIVAPETAEEVDTVLARLEEHPPYALIAPDEAVTLGPACDANCSARIVQLLQRYVGHAGIHGYTRYLRTDADSAAPPITP